MHQRRRHRLLAALAAAAAPLIGAGCGAITEGGANDTLAPLPQPGQGVLITQATLPTTQAPAGTTLAPGQTVPADDADPLSVASRFVNAAATNDSATGTALEIAGNDPDTFAWATATYESTLDVAGAEAWGGPQCTPPAGATVTCTWLQNDPNTSLVLRQDGEAWRVSHPLYVPPGGEPAAVGPGCVIGDLQVNMRGGPAKTWPRFVQIAPGTCDVTALDATSTDSEGVWRYIEYQGQRGWIVDRVLRMQ